MGIVDEPRFIEQCLRDKLLEVRSKEIYLGR